jgi:ATP-dependent DNA helicase RecG
MLLTEALIRDGTGSLRCVWFQQPYLAYAFRQGTAVLIAGTLNADTYGPNLQNPIIERDQPEALHAGRIVPVYALTSGISQKQLRIFVHAALPATAALSETLPEDVRRTERLIGIVEAVRELHFPSTPNTLARARERFAFEELFLYFQRIRASRDELDRAEAPKIPIDASVVQEFIAALPFALTKAQERAVQEVLGDMAGSTPPLPPPLKEGEKVEVRMVRPMQRLLNGDVGSGKTVVAAIAAAVVARAGFQTAYLAPTEVLAQQQAFVFERWLRPLGIRIALWTRTSQQLDGCPVPLRELTSAVRDGTVSVVIGTHAILAPRVRFHHLGLSIVDEQHRFGVEQRAALRAKAASAKPQATSPLLPHLLSMTATPIPRTFNLALLGDLDVSVLDELPRGRSPVQTSVIAPSDRIAMTRAIRAEIEAGHQVFVVCPKIDVRTPSNDGSEIVNEVAAVTEAFERAQRAFPGVPIGLLHGRLKRDVQAAVMDEFTAGRFPLLVSTTVIEVGVDCSNATVMVVEDAERFGLAQLHQLRGRVGRGAAPGACYLTTRSEDPGAIARLHRVAVCTDGFRLAELDLAERGPGAIIGTVQSGWPALRYATLAVPFVQRVQRAVARTGVPTTDAVRAAHLE